MEHKLTAILAADVVGYSRLMEADEAETLAALKAHREALIDRTFAERHGRIFTFQMAEVAVPRDLFREILKLIEGLRWPTLAAG